MESGHATAMLLLLVSYTLKWFNKGDQQDPIMDQNPLQKVYLKARGLCWARTLARDLEILADLRCFPDDLGCQLLPLHLCTLPDVGAWRLHTELRPGLLKMRYRLVFATLPIYKVVSYMTAL
ncbi:hypothetical protein PoB_004171600 [Plakobranchus ocellatus]|uniref:Uncharacterized protein n=1 Tax=Plakobranchus ocellatus TaxID=259542 RepID=A0AAV4B8P9_9GAST|nr:hypothetical protein PoB_004171600 [Plakobranchus ocellatus]